ncbi:MAG TPA: DUF302 domain-containing protein [Kribbellaceae bacterium]|nr:DUF302 domain-containing protein [Kribbellaceae bacterium]
MTGISTQHSAAGVTQTVTLIRQHAERRGATVFAVIDHAAAAREVSLDMPATQVVIFGNPAAGTPLMLATPEIALDLPLRVLVRDDGHGGCLVSWQQPKYVAVRFGLDAEQARPLMAVAAVVSDALGSADADAGNR